MDSGPRRSSPATPAPRIAETPAALPAGAGRRVALVVGIDTYAPHHRNLANARNDAIAVSQRLTGDFGFTVTPLLDEDATAAAIWAVLRGWRTRLAPEDDAVLFFAGHGTSVTSAGRHPEGYLLPADAAHTPDTWLSEADLVAHARTLPAQRVLLILDACYAGTALRLSDAVRAGEREDQVIRILVAGTERQPVLDAGGGGQHSVFTRALLDGLDGLADTGQHPDGAVSARELITFVCAEVPWRSRVRQDPGTPAQTPVGGTIQARPDDADLTFTPTRPRLPATILRNLYSPQPADREAAARQLADLYGAATAPLAARELVRLLEEGKAEAEAESVGPGLPAPPRPAETALLAACAASLGALGELSGFGPLLHLLADERPGSPRPAAAEALGRLVATSSAAHPDRGERQRQQALETLIGLLGVEPTRPAPRATGPAPPPAAVSSPDPALREAAKAGLAHVPTVAPALAARLTAGPPAEAHPKPLPRPARTELADALAVIGQRNVRDDVAWPRLPTLAAWERRWHLARRRLAPRLAAILGDAGVVGAAAATALALTYLGITLVAFSPRDARAFAPGAISVGALPGLLAGMALFGLPRATSAASRFQSMRSGAVGGLLAGLVVAAALWVPHWYLGIGCPPNEGCPPNAEWLWLVPGLVAGPALGVIAGTVLPAPGWPHGRRWGAPLLVAVSVATFAGVRMAWPALLTGRADDVRLELGMWALGGLAFGLALALLWPTTAETSTDQPTREGGP